jgi:hypothetical protein
LQTKPSVFDAISLVISRNFSCATRCSNVPQSTKPHDLPEHVLHVISDECGALRIALTLRARTLFEHDDQLGDFRRVALSSRKQMREARGTLLLCALASAIALVGVDACGSFNEPAPMVLPDGAVVPPGAGGVGPQGRGGQGGASGSGVFAGTGGCPGYTCFDCASGKAVPATCESGRICPEGYMLDCGSGGTGPVGSGGTAGRGGASGSAGRGGSSGAAMDSGSDSSMGSGGTAGAGGSAGTAGSSGTNGAGGSGGEADSSGGSGAVDASSD